MRPKVVLGILLVVGCLLMVPLVAMRYSDHVVWDLGDFVIAFVLLAGTGLLFELAAGRVHSRAYQVAIGIALAAALLLVWVNLAVGMIGNEENPANLMYLGVLGVGFLGSLIARFRPRGMSHALFATGLAHATVAAVALVGRMNGAPVLDFVFVLAWIGSASLFQRAAGMRSRLPAGFAEA